MTFISFGLGIVFATFEAKRSSYSDTDYSFVIIICLVCFAFFLIATLFVLLSALLWLHDPEAWAYAYLFGKF